MNFRMINQRVSVGGDLIGWSDLNMLAGITDPVGYSPFALKNVLHKIHSIGMDDVLQHQLEFEPVLRGVESRGVGFHMADWLQNGIKPQFQRRRELSQIIAEQLKTLPGLITSNQDLVSYAAEAGKPIQSMSFEWLKDHFDDEFYRTVFKREVVGQYMRRWQDGLVARYGYYDHVLLKGHYFGYASVSGRCSARNLPMMALPVQFRDYMEPADPEKAYVSFDLAEIELRIASARSHCSILINTFQNGEDVHKLTAVQIIGKQTDDITLTERKIAKRINYAFIFGAGAKALDEQAQKLGAGIEDNSVYDKFCASYPELAQLRYQYQHSQWLEIVGNKRHISARTFKRQQRMNIPIQSLGAVLLKRLAIAIDKLHGVKIVNLIHDEIVVEVDKADMAKHVTVIKEVMINTIQNWDLDIVTKNIIKTKILGGNINDIRKY